MIARLVFAWLVVGLAAGTPGLIAAALVVVSTWRKPPADDEGSRTW